MKNKTPEDVIKWLKTNPSLSELSSAYPDLWECVRIDIAEIVSGGTMAELQGYLKQSELRGGLLAKKCQNSRGDSKIMESTLQQLISSRMAHLAVKQHCISEATGIEKGKVRFNLLNGYIAQWLLFSEGLVRKPVSMFWFRLLWPVLWQKKMLMPLVQPEGIYCFYSKRLIDELARMIGSRSCLEIAAGDGALSHFLGNAGVSITATDDCSWKLAARYPECVVKMEAREALQKYAPEVVICSWPPADNSFERQVFRTRSVQLYIVISSRHKFAAGNWIDYGEQVLFEFGEDRQLGHLVLPPELDSAVYLFARKRVN